MQRSLPSPSVARVVGSACRRFEQLWAAWTASMTGRAETTQFSLTASNIRQKEDTSQPPRCMLDLGRLQSSQSHHFSVTFGLSNPSAMQVSESEEAKIIVPIDTDRWMVAPRPPKRPRSLLQVTRGEGVMSGPRAYAAGVEPQR